VQLHSTAVISFSSEDSHDCNNNKPLSNAIKMSDYIHALRLTDLSPDTNIKR